jgi:hypothetical protein
VQRVVRAYGQAFERAAVGQSPSLAIAWLQPVYDAYRSHAMVADATRVHFLIAEKGEDAGQEMQTLKIPVRLSKEKLDEMLNTLTDGSVERTLQRIAARFLPSAQAFLHHRPPTAVPKKWLV